MTERQFQKLLKEYPLCFVKTQWGSGRFLVVELQTCVLRVTLAVTDNCERFQETVEHSVQARSISVCQKFGGHLEYGAGDRQFAKLAITKLQLHILLRKAISVRVSLRFGIAAWTLGAATKASSSAYVDSKIKSSVKNFGFKAIGVARGRID